MVLTFFIIEASNPNLKERVFTVKQAHAASYPFGSKRNINAPKPARCCSNGKASRMKSSNI
jgi:hypothetical protein